MNQKHCYPYAPSFRDIVNLAPLFFVLLAEGSLAWRRQRLKEVGEAIDRSAVFAREDHLYFTKYLTDIEHGYGAEEESIEKADFCGETIKNDNGLDFADIE